MPGTPTCVSQSPLLGRFDLPECPALHITNYHLHSCQHPRPGAEHARHGCLFNFNNSARDFDSACKTLHKRCPSGQNSETFPTNTERNGLQPPLREEEQNTLAKRIEAERIGQPPTRQATGPRTVQGKKRSRLNALKHGLLSKCIVLEGDSRAEYFSLLRGLQVYFQPQGKLEIVLTENLAALLWRSVVFFRPKTRGSTGTSNARTLIMN